MQVPDIIATAFDDACDLVPGNDGKAAVGAVPFTNLRVASGRDFYFGGGAGRWARLGEVSKRERVRNRRASKAISYVSCVSYVLYMMIASIR